MKMSEQTLQILKNFSGINNSITFKEGNVVKVRSLAKDILAQVNIEETLPKDFAIYEVNRFLSVVGMFDAPEFDFETEDNAALIGEGKNKVRYSFTDPSLIAGADYSKDLRLGSIIASIELKQDQIAKVLKGANVLSVPNITIGGANGKITLSARDKSNSSSDAFSFEAGETDAEFEVSFKSDVFKMLPGDYKVDVTERTIVRFVHASIPLTYYVAGEVSVK